MKDFSPQTTLDNLNETLDTYGVAVVVDVFTRDECETCKRRVLEHISSKFNIQHPDEFARLRPVAGGILHHYGVQLIEPVLTLKTDARVVDVFKRVWPNHGDELSTSLDGIHIGPPPELTSSRRFFDPLQTSFHTDQASNKKSKCCVQAFVNLEATETGDGCLSVLTGSHKYFNEFFAHFGLDSRGKDWFAINKTTHSAWFLKHGCEWNTILAPAGSIVLWNSRTIHMGTLPRLGRPNPDRWRFLVYVCYTPASRQTKEDAKLKRHAYMNNQCTSHWPYGVRLMNKTGDDLTQNDLQNLTERHRKYLGIDEK